MLNLQTALRSWPRIIKNIAHTGLGQHKSAIHRIRLEFMVAETNAAALMSVKLGHLPSTTSDKPREKGSTALNLGEDNSFNFSNLMRTYTGSTVLRVEEY